MPAPHIGRATYRRWDKEHPAGAGGTCRQPRRTSSPNSDSLAFVAPIWQFRHRPAHAAAFQSARLKRPRIPQDRPELQTPGWPKPAYPGSAGCGNGSAVVNFGIDNLEAIACGRARSGLRSHFAPNSLLRRCKSTAAVSSLNSLTVPWWASISSPPRATPKRAVWRRRSKCHS